MSQTYPDIEHIIIDAKSKDGTLQVIQECQSPRIARIVSEPDHGAYEGMNKGVRLATGDIIHLLHSDDVYYDDTVVADVVEVFERTGCDMVYCDGFFVSPKNPNWVIRDWISGDFTNEKMENGWLPLHTTVFVKREVYERFGYYREDYRISSDTCWLLTCMYKTGIKTQYLHKHVIKMAYGGLSTSFSKTMLRWREDLGIYHQIGLSPRKALLKKVLRKIPQFLKAPFSKVNKSHMLTEEAEDSQHLH